MSTSRKKKLIAECDGCLNFVLARDLEKHKMKCGLDPLESEVQLICPRRVLVCLGQNIEHVQPFLPPDICGWEKHSAVLLHPDTMAQLGVIPRQPCLLQEPCKSRIVTVWPCDALSHMRICHGSAINDCLIRVLPIPESSVKAINYVCLKPVSTLHKFYFTKHFREYVIAFLSNSYLSPSTSIQIPFYGRKCEFCLESPVEEQMQTLNVSDGQISAIVFKVAPKCNFVLKGVSFDGESSTSLSFSDFGGASKAKSDIETFLISPLRSGKRACSMIMTGVSGSGKSLMLRIIHSILGSLAVKLRQDEDFDEQILLLADKCPVALLIDDFDELNKTVDYGLVQKISRLIDMNGDVAVVLVARNVEQVDLSLRRRFPLEIELMVPSLSERIEILKILLRGKSALSDAFIHNIAEQTHGFTGSDLQCVLKLANLEDVQRRERSSQSELQSAVRRVRPTGIRQFVLEVPDVRWEDICGNDALKLEIQQAVIWPHLHKEAFARFGISAPSGILLYGPPGCSKTLVARAIASQSRLNFLAVKGPELFNKWVGESEKAVRELFRRARQVAPSILFFDEIDAVAASRGDKAGSGVGDRVLAQLLTELDGLEAKSGVLFLAATNRPDTLDSAMLRPGRLDRSIYVPLPDRATRKAILLLHLRKMKVLSETSLDDFLDIFAEKTEGYSGAEVVAFCRNAALLAMREDINAEGVHKEHFDKSLTMIVPRTDKKLLEIYETFGRGRTI